MPPPAERAADIEPMPTLRSGFLRSCHKFADRPALEIGDQRLSYAELLAEAASLAATLQQHAPEVDPALTAVFAHRSTTAFAGILGSLLRGHGYVPLNSTFPIERTRTMLQRANCNALIVDREAASQLPELLPGIDHSLVVLLPDLEDVGELRANWPQHRFIARRELSPASEWHKDPVDENEIAYLLFTSGSTGVPKGVMVAHRNVTHFVDAMVQRYQVSEADRFSQMFDLSFDLSVFDMFVAWERGACVCCPSQMQKLVPSKFMVESQISIWFSVPSTGVLLSRLKKLKPDLYPNLRLSLFCGEALPVEVIRSWCLAAPNSIVENLYGPTELTIACTLYRWDPQNSDSDCELGVVPIGEPYPGMTVLVADEALLEVAPGETGELLMSGPQLTLGYWNDPQKTAAAFVTPPGQDRVFYRTGDRVRRAQADRPMVYLGRVDNQIKIQGYRVELGEIEAVLREEAQVDVAIAIGWPLTTSGADAVVAFIAADQADVPAITARARERLPSYMLPREIRLVSEFPLNVNGKVDRQALRAQLEDGD